jgi:hypothetical protein
MRRVPARLLLAVSVTSVGLMGSTMSGDAQWGGGGGGGGNNNYTWMLYGQFAFTGSSGCLVAPGTASSPPTSGNTTQAPGAGFDTTTNPPTVPITPATSFYVSSTVEGIRTFNGDGTGSVSGTEMGFTPRPTPNGTASTCGETTTSPPTAILCGAYPNFKPSAESFNFSYRFTYTVNPDGSWTADVVPGTYKGTFLTGPRSVPTAQTFTVSNFPELSGLIGTFGQTLTVATLTPTVETTIYSNGDVFPKICHRSRVLTNMFSWSQQSPWGGGQQGGQWGNQ